jgi:hypothetical protein
MRPVVLRQEDREHEHLAIGRVDYQWNNNHSMFGRYQLARLTSKPDNDPNNVLAYANGPIDDTIALVRLRRYVPARAQHRQLVARPTTARRSTRAT